MPTISVIELPNPDAVLSWRQATSAAYVRLAELDGRRNQCGGLTESEKLEYLTCETVVRCKLADFLMATGRG